jgi:hypothetical protein
MDTYPNSPAMVMCNDDDGVSALLQNVNEQFEDYAVLSDVLKAVCGLLGLGTSPCCDIMPPPSCSASAFWV